MATINDADLIRAAAEIHQFGDVLPRKDADTAFERLMAMKRGLVYIDFYAGGLVLTAYGRMRVGAQLTRRTAPKPAGKPATVLQFTRGAKDRAKALTNQRANPDRPAAKSVEQEPQKAEMDAKA